MDPGNYSIRRLDGFEEPVVHGMEKQESLLADPCTIVMELGVGFAPLLPMACLISEAACHHLTHDD